MQTNHSPMLAGTIQGSSQGRTRTFKTDFKTIHLCDLLPLIQKCWFFDLFLITQKLAYRTKISSPAAIECIEAMQGMTP